jgi:hypothetical protein
MWHEVAPGGCQSRKTRNFTINHPGPPGLFEGWGVYLPVPGDSAGFSAYSSPPMDAHPHPAEIPAIPAVEKWAIGLVTALGLALRLALWSTQAIPSVDGIAYLRIARSFAGGPPIETVHQYGYPLLVWLTGLALPNLETAARLVALAGGVALIPLTWLLARSFIADPRLRLLPALAVAFTPLPVRYSITTMSDLPYLALFMGMLVLFARRRELEAGLLGGAAYTIRPEGLLGVLVLAALRGRRFERSRRLLLGALVLVIPYVVAVGLRDGRWTLTPKSINIAASTWEEAEARAGESPVPIDFRTRLSRFGGETLRTYPSRAVDVAVQLLRQSGWTPVPLAAAGLAGPPLMLIAGLAQIVFLPTTFIGTRVRYVLPFLPLLWILAAVAIGRFRRKTLRAAAMVLMVAGIAFTAWLERDLYTSNEDGYFPELVEAGKWLADFSTDDRIVYDRKPYTAWYAGALGRYTPDGAYDDIVNEVVAGGDFLVVNDWVSERFRPALLPLVRDASTVASERRLVPIYFEQSTRGMRTVIYRVVRPGGPPPLPGEEEIRGSLVRLLLDERKAVR